MVFALRKFLRGMRHGPRTDHDLVDRESALNGVSTALAVLAEGRFAEALTCVDDALLTAPQNVDLLHARGNVLAKWGRWAEGSAAYRAAIASTDSPSASLLRDAGWCEYLASNFDAAVGLQRRAVAAAETPDSCFALGVALFGSGNPDEALRWLCQVAEIAPGFPDLALNVGLCERARHDNIAAEKSFRSAIEANVEDAHAWCMLAMSLLAQSKAIEACAAFRRSCDIDASSGRALNAFGQYALSLVWLGRADEALNLCGDHLATNPDPIAHAAFAFALLTKGHYRQGWQQYEYRWFQEPLLAGRAKMGAPLWCGQPLGGKVILLRSEQGFGDVIQFARFAQAFKSRGARVVLQVHDALVQLSSGFVGVDAVVANQDPIPTCDYYLNLMGVPAALALDVGDIPNAVPYLVPPTGSVDPRLRERTSAPRIGIVWAGNPKHTRDRERSIPLAILAPLWNVKGVEYFSLQRDLRQEELEALPSIEALVDLRDSLDSFAATARAIRALDLVISVDTAVAHLAGALGKPVWLMVPRVADFRWLEGTSRSPWYPSMRLFRQDESAAWPQVIDTVARSLERLVAGDESAHADDVGSRQLNTEPPIVVTAVARVAEAREAIFQWLPGDEQSESISTYGEYLPELVAILEELVPANPWLLEHGCGIGVHSVLIAKRLAAQIVCYEPNAVLRRILVNNLKANDVIRAITLPRGILAGVEPRSWGNSEGESPITTIDDLKVGRLSLLKLSDPGSAATLLQGAEATLWRLRSLVCARFLDEDGERGLVDPLRNYGYRCWRAEIPLYNPENFNRAEQDVFDGRTARFVIAVPEEREPGEALQSYREV